MIHDKLHHIATLAASEAFENAFARRHVKGGCLFVVKRTQAKVVGTAPFELYKIADHINDLCRIKYAVYGFSVNHESFFRENKGKKFDGYFLIYLCGFLRTGYAQCDQ